MQGFGVEEATTWPRPAAVRSCVSRAKPFLRLYCDTILALLGKYVGVGSTAAHAGLGMPTGLGCSGALPRLLSTVVHRSSKLRQKRT